MKKTIVLLILVVLFFWFGSAQEPLRVFSKKSDIIQRTKSFISKKRINVENTKSKPILDSIKIKSWSIYTSGLCLTWDYLVRRDRFANKMLEISKKMNNLKTILEKINYPSQNILNIIDELSQISTDIKNVCRPVEIKKYRDQSKEILSELRKEISSLKKYLYLLRKK